MCMSVYVNVQVKSTQAEDRGQGLSVFHSGSPPHF